MPPLPLPTGEVTFLFTDVVGSTQHFARLGEAWAEVLEHHDALVTGAVTASGGAVVRTQGDSVFAAFGDQDAALASAIAAQRALRDAAWPDEPIRVRMGLHRGPARARGGDYTSLAVHHAARFMAAAGAGQILCSDELVTTLRRPPPAGCGLEDLGRYWLKDLDAPQRLWGVRIDGDGAGVARPHTPSALTPAPRVRSTFIGRESDLRRVIKEVGDHPLVSVVGPGGAGKTRLVVEAVHRGDGLPRASFVDLTALAPEAAGAPATDMVAAAVLQALGTSPPAASDLAGVLVEQLVGEQLLVVLDNCEHVLQGAAAVCSALLRADSPVQILTTSRAPLGIAGEEVVTLGELELPEDSSDVALLTSPAIRLLDDRVGQARGGKKLPLGELGELLPALRAVGALPLTIELLAARLRTLRPRDLAERLASPLDVLSSAPRDAATRHRSLRDVIEWSTSLLDGVALLVLCRSTVFLGPPTIGDLEAVVDGDGVPSDGVLDAVDRLVDGSLATLDERGRLVLPVPIRAWATEALAATGSADAVADRHLAHLVGVAGSAPERLAGSLRSDLPAALRHAAHRDRRTDAARLVVAAAPALAPESLWRDLWDVAADALDPTRTTPRLRTVVEAWLVIANWAHQLTETATGTVFATAAIESAAAMPDGADLLAKAHLATAGVCAALDDPDGARAALAAASSAAETADEGTRLRVQRHQISLLEAVPPAERIAGLRDLLPRIERDGEPDLVMDTRIALAATVALTVQDAGPQADEAGRLLDDLLDPGEGHQPIGLRERGRLLQARSRVRWFQGSAQGALDDLAAGIEAATASGDPLGRTMLRNQAAAFAAANGRGQEAADLYEEVLSFARRRAPFWIDDARALLLDVQVRRRMTGEVRRHVDEVDRERSAERKPQRALTFDVARVWLRLQLDPSAAPAVPPLVEAADDAEVAGAAELAFSRLGPSLAAVGCRSEVTWLLRRAVDDRRERDVRLTALSADAIALTAAAVEVDPPLLAELVAMADHVFANVAQGRLAEEAAAIDAVRPGLPRAEPPSGEVAEVLLAGADALLAWLDRT